MSICLLDNLRCPLYRAGGAIYFTLSRVHWGIALLTAHLSRNHSLCYLYHHIKMSDMIVL